MKKILKTAFASVMALMMTSYTADAQEVKKEVRNGKVFIVHKIKAKENYYSIARDYKTTPKELQEANPNIAVLKVGDNLYVPTDEEAPNKNIPTLKAPQIKIHKVQSKEFLGQIARKYNLSVQELKELNNLESDKITPGQELIVSKSKGKKDTKLSETKGTQTIAQNNKGTKNNVANNRLKIKTANPEKVQTEEYKIQKGETLSSIARKFNVSNKELLALNEELDEGRIVEGKSILVPITQAKVEDKPNKETKVENKTVENRELPLINTDKITNPFEDPIGIKDKFPDKKVEPRKQPEKVITKTQNKEDNSFPTNDNQPILHTVKSGESFESIRGLYNISRTEIKFWNNYEWDNDTLHIGQKLRIYKPEQVNHTVKNGEKLKDIAKKYGVNARQIEIWNKGTIVPKTPLLPETSLLIYKPTGPKPSKAYLDRKKEIEEGRKNRLITSNDADATEKWIEHKVEKGQGMYSIIKKYKVTAEEVMDWNNLKDNQIKAGAILKIKTKVNTEIMPTLKEENKQQPKQTPKETPKENKGQNQPQNNPVKTDILPPIVNTDTKVDDDKNLDPFGNNMVTAESKPKEAMRGGNPEVKTDKPNDDNLPTKKDNEAAIVNPVYENVGKPTVTPIDMNTIIETGLAQVIPDIPSPKPQAALHKTLEPGTTVIVKNTTNGRVTIVEVAAKFNPANVDADVILQVSPAVYQKLGIDGSGKIEVEISYIKK